MTTTDQPKFPSADERLRAAPLPEPPTEALKEERDRARRDRFFVILASMAAALGLIGAVVALGGRDEAISRSNTNAESAARAEAKASAAAEQANGATDAAKEANRRLAALGKPTVPVPTVTITPEPPPVPVQVDGLTGSQATAVRTIISSELLRYRPSLSKDQADSIARSAAALVPKPADGKTPTAAQLQPMVQAALLGFCANGRCDGKTGAAGKNAPAPTDDQLRPLIISALASYCAALPRGTCEGSQGEAGKPGADSTVPGPPGPSGPPGVTGDPGQDGRSVVDTDCVSDGAGSSNWVVTYDRALPSGSETEVVMGPCRVEPILPSAAARTK